MSNDYPVCGQFGLVVVNAPIPHIPRMQLDILSPIVRQYVSEQLDGQTCYIAGPYPWDVERILKGLRRNLR